MPSPGQLRPLLSAVLGAVAGGLLHRAVLDTTGSGPVGWRVVSSAPTTGLAPPTGPHRAPGTWVLQGQETWFARTSLPGRRLRSIELEATLAPRGQLDIWLTRNGIESPSAGDMVLRLDRYTEGQTQARVLTWAPDGPHRVSCSPTLAASDGTQTAVRAHLTDGLLKVWLNGEASVCAVVGGSDPPALQAGHHRVRVARLEVDGRPVHAPDPGPWWLWGAVGALLSLAAGRLEQATGASWAVGWLGDALVLGTAGLALLAVRQVDGLGVAAVAGAIGGGALGRAALHAGRAMRPVPGQGDWTRTAAIAAVLPALGLLLLAEPGSHVVLPWGVLGVGTAGAVAGLTLALYRRPRAWRAVAMMGALVSAAALLGRVVGGGSIVAVGAAALAGGGLAATVGGLARTDRHGIARALGAICSLVAVVCALELATLAMSEPASDAPHTPLGPAPVAPIAALPGVPDGGVVFTGPFAHVAHGHQSAARTLHGHLQRPVHRVGDARWGLVELAESLELAGGRFSAGAVILTVGSPPDSAAHGRRNAAPARGIGLTGLGVLSRQLVRTPSSTVDRLSAALQDVVAALLPKRVPLVVVLGPSGPDPAPLDHWRTAIEGAQRDDNSLTIVDLGEQAHSDPAWLDARGLPSEQAWESVAAHLKPLLD